MELPIEKNKDRIVDAVNNNRVVVIVGETGSGKTTRIGSYLYEAGLAKDGTIGITEPRRIAVTSTAKYVAGRIGSGIGNLVGYQIRFEDETSAGTALKFMTDGILLREFQIDPDLRKYSIIVIDEAHERSQNIDFILGLLKDLLKRRDDLKVVIASATIDEQKFSNFFDGAPIINVSGRIFPVEVVWSNENANEQTIVEMTVQGIVNLHRYEPKGDILAFMTGESDIRQVIESLERMNFGDLVAIPAHASLPWEEQQKIYAEYPGKRKVVVATNIAETGITIEGLVYVVNGGLIKQKNFHSNTGIESLDVVEHSQAGCKQREGRAGRTQPGKCLHLFTKDNFRSRSKFTEPEIKRISLAGVVLAMKDIGIDDIESFEFIDSPSRESFHEAHETLIALGAVQRKSRGLTEIGKKMARLPIEPRIARMLIEADKHGCISEVATVAAFLSGKNIFLRPRDKESEADQAHSKFKDKTSDALTFLNVWDAYRDNDYESRWCSENYISSRAMREINDILSQLFDILESSGIKLTTGKDDNEVVKAVSMGLAYNLMERRNRYSYNGVFRQIDGVFVHPGSAIFGLSNPRWMVVTEIVRTSKNYARGCTQVRPEWLPDIAPQHFKWGEPVIENYIETENQVSIKRPVLDKAGYEIGSSKESIPVSEAKEIQDRMIREAKRDGLLKLVFRNQRDGHLYPHSSLARFASESNEKKYRMTFSAKIEEGVPYYCKIVDTFLGNETVEPVFRVFNFGDLESPIGRPLGQIEQLAQKWGAGLKR